MTCRVDVVHKAIKFGGPERLPVWFFNRESERGDVVYFDLSLRDGQLSEWGYEWEVMDDGTMGQPAAPVLPAWEALEQYKFPESYNVGRTNGIQEFHNKAEDRYKLAGLGLTGFTIYTFLRGFENALIDLALESDAARSLLGRIFLFENELITIAAENGLHGVHFQDDWGTQQGLIISPKMWRDVFKPLYCAQFKHAHDLGLHVWFHSCGNILKILPDFNQIGVDVMNVAQPNVVDLDEVSCNLRGKQCFMIPISYQTVSIAGTPDDIQAEANRLCDLLSTPEGGFIGYVEEYSCMGMSEENYQACASAFERYVP